MERLARALAQHMADFVAEPESFDSPRAVAENIAHEYEAGEPTSMSRTLKMSDLSDPTTCEHRKIETYSFSNGPDVGAVAMWGCVQCRRKFAPRRTTSGLDVGRALRDDTVYGPLLAAIRGEP